MPHTPSAVIRLRIWGCRAYVLKPKADRTKDFDAKTYSGIFVGCGEQKMGYEVLFPDTNKIVTSVHVMFNEILPAQPAGYHTELEELAHVKVLPCEGRTVQLYQYILGTKHKNDETILTYEVKRVAVSREDWIVGYRSLVTSSRLVSTEEAPVHIADIHLMTTDLLRPGDYNPDGRGPTVGSDFQKKAGVSNTSRRRPTRAASQPAPQGQRTLVEKLSCTLMHPGQALRHPDADQRIHVIGGELASLYQNRQCWEYVAYPRNGIPLLKVHFVFKAKMRDGKVIKRKACLVVGGHRLHGNLRPGYKVYYVPHVLSIACMNSMLIHQLDFERAFAYAPENEDIYVRPHPEMRAPDDMVCKLQKVAVRTEADATQLERVSELWGRTSGVHVLHE